MILAILFKPFDSEYPVSALWFWLSYVSPLILTILFKSFDSEYPV